jgi:hypothetical protein
MVIRAGPSVRKRRGGRGVGGELGYKFTGYIAVKERILATRPSRLRGGPFLFRQVQRKLGVYEDLPERSLCGLLLRLDVKIHRHTAPRDASSPPSQSLCLATSLTVTEHSVSSSRNLFRRVSRTTELITSVISLPLGSAALMSPNLLFLMFVLNGSSGCH